MSGYFSRSLYDNCNIQSNTDITTGPGTWVLNTSIDHQNACFPDNGPRNTRGYTSSEIGVKYTDAIDIENSLKGLDVPLSKCYSNNTLVDKDERLNKLYNNIPKKEFIDCPSENNSDKSTRLDLRDKVIEKPFNRYEYPIIDHKEFIYFGFNQYNMGNNNRNGISTRYDVKTKLIEHNKKLKKKAEECVIFPHNS